MWKLYMKNGQRVIIGEYGSADYCRTVAMRNNRSDSSMNLGREFVIVDPSGHDHQQSVNTHGWRMKWVWCRIENQTQGWVNVIRNGK
jgi:hypothetical protein